MAEIHWVGTPTSDKAVIFIHGVNGDWKDSWRNPDTEYSWPEGLAQEPGWRTASIEYDANTNWGRDTMPLRDRAINILDLVRNDPGLKNREFCLVTHSFGGLVAKQMVRAAYDRRQEYGGLIARLAGIVFLGTPHQGAGFATFLDYVGHLLGSTVTVEELRSSSPVLRDLGEWFRNHETARRIPCKTFFETRRTRVGRRWFRPRTIRVVDEASADPAIAGSTPVPVDADHPTIAKPASARAEQAVATANFLTECFRMPARLGRLPQQAAAVCYKRGEHGVELLLVRTTGGRWTFPKGGVGDHPSPLHAAEAEAEEEAGARGLLDPDPLGVYLHARREWNVEATTEFAVTAYLMQVRSQKQPADVRREPTWFLSEDARQALSKDREGQYAQEFERIIDLALKRLG